MILLLDLAQNMHYVRLTLNRLEQFLIASKYGRTVYRLCVKKMVEGCGMSVSGCR